MNAWNDLDAKPLTVVEEDLRQLMRQLAEVRFELDEEKKQGVDKQRKFYLEILDALDAFDRIFRNIHEKEDLVTPQMKIWINNFRSVRRLLEKVLTERNIIPIQILDSGFDPVWHEILETITDPTRPDGTIVEEVQRGYLWNREILRKATLVVVRNSDLTTPEINP